MDALESTVRMNADRIMLSEVRSIEVKSLITCWSQGAKGVTSLHTDHVKKIPDRILNLMPTKEDAERLKNNVYEKVLDSGEIVERVVYEVSSSRIMDVVQIPAIFKEEMAYS